MAKHNSGELRCPATALIYKEIKRQGDAEAGLYELYPEKNYKSGGTLQVADKNFFGMFDIHISISKSEISSFYSHVW